MIKFKKEKVLILKCKNEEDIRVYIQARTFEYKGYKFNLQGNYNIGYRISDNSTGVLLGGAALRKLKDVESANTIFLLEHFLNNIKDGKEYLELKARFENANIEEE